MRVLEYLLSLLYPRKCPFCTRIIDERKKLCVKCEKKLPFVPMGLMLWRIDYIDECYSVFYYKDAVKDSIHRFKFESAAAYAEIYGSYLAKCIDENGISCDIITWVPLSRGRFRQRGYDQAKLLAYSCSKNIGTECAALLKKIRENPAQSSTASAELRKANVAGAYEINSGVDLKGKVVLIIDDVVTTGATVSECSRMLRKAGAAKIIALTVACTSK